MNRSGLERNLSLLHEAESEVELILTINARHMVAHHIIREYSEVIEQYANAGFCFVAGNPTYLSEEEKALKAGPRLAELVSACRGRLPLAPIFVGSEGLTDLTLTLADKYSTIPFRLLDSRGPARTTKIEPNEPDGAAVYCPCSLSVHNEMRTIRTFGPYAIRRKWVRRALTDHGLRPADIRAQLADGGLIGETAVGVLGDAIQHLALCGMHQTERSLRRFSLQGISHVALLLAENGYEEERELNGLVSRLNA